MFDYDGSNTLSQKFSWIDDEKHLCSNENERPQKISKKSSKNSIMFIENVKLKEKKLPKEEHLIQSKLKLKRPAPKPIINQSMNFVNIDDHKIYKKIKINQSFNNQTNLFIINQQNAEKTNDNQNSNQNEENYYTNTTNNNPYNTKKNNDDNNNNKNIISHNISHNISNNNNDHSEIKTNITTNITISSNVPNNQVVFNGQLDFYRQLQMARLQ